MFDCSYYIGKFTSKDGKTTESPVPKTKCADRFTPLTPEQKVAKEKAAEEKAAKILKDNSVNTKVKEAKQEEFDIYSTLEELESRNQVYDYV